jgi:uncharacterized CHY-type Zn-finger protein
MGYYNIHELFENFDWENRTHREGDELVVDGGLAMVCPRCLTPFWRARYNEAEGIRCPNCDECFEPAS